MRSKKAVLNMAFSLVLQIITIGFGFLIPKLIIETFGSSVNGLTTSITQFLGYLVLLQSGVGGVVRASLYKPLAENDTKAISRIIKAAENFFKKIAYITIAYVSLLAIILPYVVIDNNFDYQYIALLVLIIGIGTFAQYYFGITSQMLLQADQRSYIATFVQIGSVIVNALLVAILIKLGSGIHIVTLGSSLVFFVRPIILYFYVIKKYSLDKTCKPDEKSLAQRWDGFGHTIAYFIHNKVDIFLLTIFSNLKEISVYSVYTLITNGLNTLVSTVASAVQAAFGNMIAQEEFDLLNKNFKAYECFTHILTVTLFTSAAILVVPFISIYTNAFKDINYIRPLFAYIIIAAEGVYCLRQPYHSIIISAGHYKQTKNGAFIEALINLLISLILMQFWDIVGVAIGTFLSMLFRMFDYVVYLRRRILFIRIRDFIKRMIVSIISIFFIFLMSHIIGTKNVTYFDWVSQATYTTILATIITLFINLLFYPKEIELIFTIVKRLIIKKR